MPSFCLALILIAVLILVLILVAVLVLVLILVLILLVHDKYLSLFLCGIAVVIVFTKYQDLSLSLKMMETIRPERIAAVIPPALAFSPPVRIPMTPSASMASRIPFAIQ